MSGHAALHDPHDDARCLNCGTTRVGAYCHACGQSGHIHRTLGAWWHDFSHGVLHVEGAVWRTLVLLLRAPGQLTRRYIDGERRRFLAPLPLYLFCVFVLYIVYALLGAPSIRIDPELAERTGAPVETQLARVDAAIAQGEALPGPEEQRRVSISAPGEPVSTRSLAELRAERQELLRVRTVLDGLHGDPKEEIVAFLRLHPTGWGMLDRGLLRAAEDPDFLLFKLEANGYKFSWALIPVSVPLMGVLFARRRGTTLFDHAVFVTYSLSFLTLLLTALLLLARLHVPHRHLLAWAFPLHLYAQARGTYGLSWFAAAWRSVAIMVIAAVALVVWVLLLLALGFAE